jgi:protein farnesyltransferase subunit beta
MTYRYPDAYHTCYVLAGLSSLQHKYTCKEMPHDSPAAFPAPFLWIDAAEKNQAAHLANYDEQSYVERLHPVFAIPWGRAEEVLEWLRSEQARQEEKQI